MKPSTILFKKQIWSLILLLTFASYISAQNIAVPSIPTEVVGCGDASQFTFRLFGPISAGAEVSVQLPTAAEFDTLVSGIGVTVDNSVLNKPIFTFANTLATAADFVDVVYTVNTGCAFMIDPKLLHILEGTALSTEVDYPAVAQSLLEVNNTIATSGSTVLNVGETVDYTFTIGNDPVNVNAYVNKIITYIQHSPNVVLSYSGSGTYTQGTSLSGGFYTDILELSAVQIATVGNMDSKFEKGENISATITATLVSCPSGGETISYQAGTGCLATDTVCETGNVATSSLSMNAGVDGLSIVTTDQAYPNISTPDTATMTVTNTGTGNAPLFNLEIQLGMSNGGGNSTNLSNISFYSWDNFMVNGISAGANSATNRTNLQFSSDPDGAGVGLEDLDGDGFFDDLAVGESFSLEATLSYDYLAHVNDVECASLSGSFIKTGALAYAEDKCGFTFTPTIFSNDFGAWRPWSFYNVNKTPSLTNMPLGGSTISVGDDFTFLIEHITNNDANLNINTYPNTFWQVECTLPIGVIPNGTATWGSSTMTQVSFDPSTGVAIYASSNTTTGANLSNDVSIPLTLASCTANESVTISYKYRLMGNDVTNTYFPTAYCNTSSNFIINCPTAPCEGVTVNDFSLDRTTFGYTDDTETTPVTAATAGVRVDQAMEGDMARWSTTLSVNEDNLTSAIALLTYETKNWFTNTATNGGGIEAITIDYYEAGNATTTPDFTSTDLSHYSYIEDNGGLTNHSINLLDGDLASYVPTIGAKYVITVDLEVSRACAITGDFENLTELLVSAPTSSLANPSYVCNFGTDTFGVYDNINGNLVAQGFTYDGCGTFNFGFIGDFAFYPNATVAFSNEFRSFTEPINIDILIPDGVIYAPGTSAYSNQTIADPIITYNYAPGFHKYSWVNDGSWQKYDTGSGRDLKRLYASFAAVCSDESSAVFAGSTFNSTILSTTQWSTYRNRPTPILRNSAQYNSNRAFTYNPYTYSLSSPALTATTLTSAASWDVNINNTNSGGEVLENTWVAIEVPNNNIVPTLEIGGIATPLTSYSPGKYWAQIGDVAASGATMTINSDDFAVCGTDYFNVVVGQNCGGYPTNPDAGYPSGTFGACNEESLELALATQDPAITASTTLGASTYGFCDVVPYQIDVNNGANGFAYIIAAEVSLPLGMILDNTSGVLIYDGTNYPIDSNLVSLDVPTNTYTVDVNGVVGSPIGSTNGLPGTSSTDPNAFSLTFELGFTCEFVSGTKVGMVITAEKACQEEVEIINGQNAIQSNAINLDEVPTDITYALTAMGTDEIIKACSETERINVSITNQGASNTSGALEKIVAVINDAFNYVPSSYVGGINAPVDEPTVTTNSTEGTRILTWPMPDGIAPGSSIAFDFEVEVVTPVDVLCQSYDLNVSTRVSNGIDCSATGGLSCVTLESITTQEDVALTVEKGDLIIQSTTTTSTITGTDEDLTVNFSIENTSSIAIASGTIVDLYYDDNLNGSYDAGETFLATHTVATAIGASMTIIDNFTTTLTPSQVCNLVLVLNTENNACICLGSEDTVEIPTDLPGIAGSDGTVCEVNDTILLGIAENSEYSYTWSGASNIETAYLDDATLAQPSFSYSGNDITSDTTISYTLTIARPDGCTSTDVVDVTVNPSPTLTQSAIAVCDTDMANYSLSVSTNADVLNASAGVATFISGTNWDITAVPSGTDIFVTATNTATGCEETLTITSPICIDTDGDGISDDQEGVDGTDPNDDCESIGGTPLDSSDCDGDGVTNGQEVTDGTDPLDDCSYLTASISVTVTSTSDCDGDGVPNNVEATDGTDGQDPCSFVLVNATIAPDAAWNAADCDGDGVTNGQEVTDGTDPLDDCSYLTASISVTVTSTSDCDGDGVPNNVEATDGTDGQDPCSFVLVNATIAPDAAWNAADCDGDGVTNGQEVTDGTDPLDDCSYLTASISVTVTSTSDCDGDGVPNNVEATDGTDGQDPCSFVLVNATIAPDAAWNAADCDGDGVTNGQEVTDGTDPLDDCSYLTASISVTVTSTSDCDGDGVPNNVEATDGTDGQDPCSFVLVNATIAPDAAWNAADCDGDGVTNGQEVTDGTDPLDDCSYLTASISVTVTSTSDCDGDGVPNNVEATDGTDGQDPCSFVLANATVAPDAAWNAADCDGDGVTNGQEVTDGTDPLDDCSYVTANISEIVTSTSDCDGDGVPNDVEATDGTDGQEPCSFVLANATVAPDAAWNAADCDGDGVTNGQEVTDGTDPLDDCSYLTASISVTVTSTSDCDGDGVPNDVEATDGTDGQDPCSFVLANATVTPDAAWNAADCDGDGVTNGQEVTDGTDPLDDCSYVTASISVTVTSTSDCDGDGVPNDVEATDGTDGQDPCSFVLANATVAPDAAWNAADCDGDGVTNGQEVTDGTDPLDDCSYLTASISVTVTSTSDCDGDGVPNNIEATDGTDGQDPCSFVLANSTVAPDAAWNAADCDGDGVTNGQEVTDGTDPLDDCSYLTASISVTVTSTSDCDGDGVPNNVEATDGTDGQDPCSFVLVNATIAPDAAWNAADCDGDGVTNGQEVTDGTDPLDDCSYLTASISVTVTSTSDCDGDGVPNNVEATDGTDGQDPCSFVLANATVAPDAAWNAADCDGDGVTNGQEVIDGTDPLDDCSYLTASISVTVTSTSDCDGDGVPNNVEATDGTDGQEPCSFVLANATVAPDAAWNAADCDGDGVTNGQEVTDGTDPLDDCSYLTASISVTVTSTSDCDGDGVPNDVEATDGTDGQDPCSFVLANATIAPDAAWNAADCDGDGVTNGQEVIDGTDPLDDCSYLTASISVTVTSTSDCDGDGVPNNVEATDGTDGQEPCSFVLVNATVAPDAAWNAADCDGDGVTNGQEVTDGTDPLDDCSYLTASISVTVTSTSDCDGDGVPNDVEATDGTDGQDPCSFVLANATIAPDAAWNAADCDGDGVTNGQEVTDGTDPLDDCSYLTASISVTVTSTSDCDGDGVPNNVEATDGTDGQDPCSFVLVNATIAPDAAWNAADCDGDGVTNGQEVTDGTDPLDDCSYLTASISVTVTSTSDCDGDGVPNDVEATDGTDGQDPCSFVLANATVTPDAAWNAADCDGDGVTNGQEVTDGTDPLDDCSYVTASISVTVTSTSDCDGDGVPNDVEATDGTDGQDPCSFVLANATVAPDAAWNAADCDGDGVTNGQEVTDGTDPLDDCSYLTASISVTVTSTSDCDGDGVPNNIEATDGTDGQDPCSFVLANSTVAPDAAWNAADCDGDGVTNGQEVTDGTDPLDDCSYLTASISVTVTSTSDCDGDGVPNNVEATDGTDGQDPCSFVLVNATIAPDAAWNAADCDGDGVTNGQEVTDGTDPTDECSLVTANQDATPTAAWNSLDCDGDGVTNGQEVTDGTDPTDECSLIAANQDATPTAAWNALDCDGDGVTNGQEITDDTDPTDSCSIIAANQDVIPTAVWNALDCDGDGVTNGQEISDGTDPLNDCDSSGGAPLGTSDCDNDGLTTDEEASLGTDPNNPDSDGDGILDGQEVLDGTDPLDDCDHVDGTALPDSDCDGDGLTTSQEDAIGTDSYEADTDGDTIPDGQEVEDGTDPLDPCHSIGGVPSLDAGCNAEVVDSGIAVSNEVITPDGDGTNDFFRIENIESFPNNTVQIYNRWGIVVYEMSGYDNVTNTFQGVSNGRATISKDSELPVGVYFYVIKYNNNGDNLDKSGYLYINR
ncbi:gliding motility-associated C-terminal domain-containing protein [Maribacter sp. IgM3_T14_3]|uniref:gliding motility-associated C-terminal domain-containing protein n=1 Tax=Maribacter sp. IgM3_T14_3 TaxID=3415140 RepID=UPI003C6F960F